MEAMRSVQVSDAAMPAARRVGNRSGPPLANRECRLRQFAVRHIDWRIELERLHPMSFAWALYCCRQRREEAQDVLQDVYLRVLDGHARFAGQASLKTWLFAVIRRTAIEHHRRHWLRASLMERWLQRAPIDEGSCHDDELATSEVNDSLRASLARLSQRQQEVLHLVFYQDLTIEEAAALLSISLGTARTHFERGKARLREHFRGDTAP
jgi:RNA polymerase sigma-70 factor (ECF subfamily)